MRWLALALALALASPARAQEALTGLESPYAPMLRAQYYEQLAKRPYRALGYELLAPGAGNLYVGLVAPAATTLGLSLLGASLWLAGALRDRPAMMWTGVGTFAGARAYGAISAPVAAVLLNAAFRQQLGIIGSY